jgi:hypothetical protein
MHSRGAMAYRNCVVLWHTRLVQLSSLIIT